MTANDGNSGTVSDTFNIVVSAADTTAPSVSSIERQTPSSSPTNADSVKWRVTFNEAVQNVDSGDFQVSGTALTITVVSPVTGSETTTYDVTVSSGNLAGLDGTVTLSFASGHNIQDMAGNALASSPTVSGTNDNSYVVDNTAPGVTSITRQTPATSPTGADSLTWQITFDEAVQHVNDADFQVSGTTATITAVSPVSGFETTTYDVTASGGNLAGLNATVTLSFAGTHNIEDEAGNRSGQYHRPRSAARIDNTFVVQQRRRRRQAPPSWYPSSATRQMSGIEGTTRELTGQVLHAPNPMSYGLVGRLPRCRSATTGTATRMCAIRSEQLPVPG